MKWLIPLAILCLTGCAYFEERTDAMAQCGGDTACIERVINMGKAAKAVGDATGLPWAGAAAGGVVAAMMLFFAKRRKKDGQA